jgi:hypothetical protein
MIVTDEEANFTIVEPSNRVTWADVIKLFTAVNYIFVISWSVCSWQAFPPQPNVFGNAGGYPIEEPFRCSTLG